MKMCCVPVKFYVGPCNLDFVWFSCVMKYDSSSDFFISTTQQSKRHSHLWGSAVWPKACRPLSGSCTMFEVGVFCFEGCAQPFSRVQLFATPWNMVCQAPLSMEFFRQHHWSGLPFPSTGHLPDPGIEPVSLHCRQILHCRAIKKAASYTWSQPEAEKRSFGDNIPIRDVLRHLHVRGSQILWVRMHVHVCVCVCMRVHSCVCVFRALLLPLPPRGEEARSPDLRAWTVQNLAPSSTAAMAGRPAL